MVWILAVWLECHGLTSGHSAIGAECRGSGAVGDTVFHGPQYGVIVIGIAGYITGLHLTEP